MGFSFCVRFWFTVFVLTMAGGILLAVVRPAHSAPAIDLAQIRTCADLRAIVRRHGARAVIRAARAAGRSQADVDAARANCFPVARNRRR